MRSQKVQVPNGISQKARDRSIILRASKRKSRCTKNINKFLVKQKLFYVNTIKDDKESYYTPGYFGKNKTLSPEEIDMMVKEPNPTEAELSKYMAANQRYKEYVKYTLGVYVKGKVTNEKLNGLTIEYIFETCDNNVTAEDLKNFILTDSFEDGIFSGLPGNAGVYPSKYHKLMEHGLIDCRKPANIIVKKL